MAFLQIKSKALHYPAWDKFNPQSDAQFLDLVAFLEDSVIRALAIEERVPLKSFNDQWYQTVSEYLHKLKYPREFEANASETDKLVVLDWLLNYALSVESHDNYEKYNTAARQQLSSRQVQARPIDAKIYRDPQCKVTLDNIADQLHIPVHDDPSVLIRSISKLASRKLSAAAIEQAKQEQSKGQSSKSDSQINNAKFPLGFSTGAEKLDKAATVFRLLYVSDLRRLQTKINDLLVSVQNFTADPQTNTNIGRVGT